MNNPEIPFAERVHETFVEREYEKMEREQKFQDKTTKRLNKKLEKILPVTPEEITPWELIPSDSKSRVSWEEFYQCLGSGLIVYTEIDGVGISASDESKETPRSIFYVCPKKPEPCFDQDGERFRANSISDRSDRRVPELFGGIAFHDIASFVTATEKLETPDSC